MATGYEPNIEGAIAVLVDIMTANAFTIMRQPYEPNYRGLVDAIIDLKEGFPIFAPSRIGFDASSISTGTTRTMTVPNEIGTISTQDFATTIAIALE